MTPYLIIIAIVYLLTALDFLRLKSSEKQYFYTPVCVVLVLFAGLRPDGIDRDYEAYKSLYLLMEYFEWGQALNTYSIYQMEPLFILLNKLFFSLGFSFPQFLFTYEILTGFILWRFIYRYSPFPFISLCMYVSFFYFFREFTQIRFALSSVLVMVGLFQIAEQKRMPGWTALLFAGLIHNSAWIAIFVPLFNQFLRNRWIYLVIPPVALLLAQANPINLILSLFGLPTQLSRYLDSDIEMGSSVMSYAFTYVFLILSAFNYLKLQKQYGKKFEYIYISASLSVFIGVLFIAFPIMQRISGALFTFCIIWIPYFLKQYYYDGKSAWHNLLGAAVTSIFVFYGIKVILVSNLVRPYF